MRQVGHSLELQRQQFKICGLCGSCNVINFTHTLVSSILYVCNVSLGERHRCHDDTPNKGLRPSITARFRVTLLRYFNATRFGLGANSTSF